MFKKILFLSSLLVAFSSSVAFAESPEALKCEDLYKEVFSVCQKAAEQGDVNIQYLIGGMYLYGEGVPKNFEKGIEWYTKAGKQGYVESQLKLGNAYFWGFIVDRDYKKALKWYTKAAEQGNSDAQYKLGVMYDNGLGVRQNLSTAKEWYGKACDNGLQTGCNNYKRLNKQGVR